MQCPKCKKEHRGTKFCTHCGANLTDFKKATDTIVEQQVQEQDDAVEQSAQKQDDTVKPTAPAAADPIITENIETVEKGTESADTESAGNKDEAEISSEALITDVAVTKAVMEQTRPEAQAQAQSDVEQSDTAADDAKQNVGKQQIRKQMTLSITVPVILGIFIIFFSYVLSAIMRKSSMMQDYVHLFFLSLQTLGDDLSFRLASQLQVSFWDALVLFHFGSVKGTIERISGAEPVVISDFSLYVPMLILPMILVSLFVLSYRIVYRVAVMSRLSSLICITVNGLIYAVIVTGTMLLFSPSFEWVSDNGTAIYEYGMKVNTVELFIKSFALHVVGGLFGLKLLTLWTPVKKLFVFAGSLVLLIGGMMIAAWALSNPAAFASAPTVTVASLWTEYKSDLVFYLVFPTIVVQEMLYAVGGTWQISGGQIASWLQLRPMNMHMITGVHLPLAEGEAARSEWASQMSAFARTTWHPYGLLIVILYSLSQAKAEGKWHSIFILTAVWGAACFALAAASTLRLTVGSETEIAGFSSLQVLIWAVGVGLLFFGAAYLLRKYWESRKGRLGIE